MFDVDDTVCLCRRYDPTQQTVGQQSDVTSNTKLEYEHNTGKERDSYLLRARKLEMEMRPDTLEADGVNELFVTVTLDASFITEQGSLSSLIG